MKQKTSTSSEIYLFSLFGFKVSLDWTWFFLAILITWTLSVGYFPLIAEGLSPRTYWMMGTFGALGLFISIILHELSHSLIGRLYDLPIKGIKLFVFGGIAEMSDEPPSPKAEFLMSIAGPIASFILAIFFGFIYQIGITYHWSIIINSIFGYLSLINLLLAIFNLLPGYPLDGGRVLRSFLWWWKQDLKWATRIASRTGIILGFTLLFFGILQILAGNLIGGLWISLIGLFLQYIAKASYEQTQIKLAFADELIKDYAKTNLITVTENISIQELVNNYFYKYYHKLYPVIRGNRLIGCVTLNDLENISKDKWRDTNVREIMQDIHSDHIIDANTKVSDVLQIMNTQRTSRIILAENEHLVGIITSKDLMNVISVKAELE